VGLTYVRSGDRSPGKKEQSRGEVIQMFSEAEDDEREPQGKVLGKGEGSFHMEMA